MGFRRPCFVGVALLALACCLVARADPGGERVHPIKFFLHPTLLADPGFARTVLPKYVADLNLILSKNTRRRFSFDPESGIIPALEKPQSDSYRDLPTEGFEVWVHASLSGNGRSFGGYLGADMEGAAAVAGLYWPQLYDPEALTTSEAANDYWRQINVLLHEFGHVFGAAAAEYYDVLMPDDTGELPSSEISLLDPENAYLKARPDLRLDPMMTMPSLASRQEYLDQVRYSALTAATLNGQYRWPMVRAPLPDLERLRVRLQHRDDGSPVAGALVRVWVVRTGNPALTTRLLSESVSDAEGIVTWSWQAESIDAVTTDSVRMLKIQKPGYVSVSHPVTWIDLSASTVLRGRSVLEEVVSMETERLRLTPGASGRLRVTAAKPATRFVIETSADLSFWVPWVTNRLEEGVFETVDTVSGSDSNRFFRAREVEE